MRLKDKVALVTGGGSGIGRAIALRFAQEGARVVVNDVRREAAEKTAGEIGAGARALQADVSDSAQVKGMFAEVDRDLGTLDILVNNAGIAYTADDHRASLTAKSEARVTEMLSGQGVQTHWDVTQEMTDAS